MIFRIIIRIIRIIQNYSDPNNYSGNEIAELGATNNRIIFGIRLIGNYSEIRLIVIRLIVIQLIGFRIIIRYSDFE